MTIKGWLLVAKISCSANARFILFLLIISFLLKTADVDIQPMSCSDRGRIHTPFMAYNRLLFFSRTKYTFPTSPLPSSLILSKLPGPTSTFRTLIEFELYVRRNAWFFIRSGTASPTPLDVGTRRFPVEEDPLARMPVAFELEGTSLWLPSFFVNKPWALGAEATRRSFRASSSFPACVFLSLAPDTASTAALSDRCLGVSGGVLGAEPSLW